MGVLEERNMRGEGKAEECELEVWDAEVLACHSSSGSGSFLLASLIRSNT